MKKEPHLIDWGKEAELECMFESWLNYTKINRIKLLNYIMDYGQEDVTVPFSLN